MVCTRCNSPLRARTSTYSEPRLAKSSFIGHAAPNFILNCFAFQISTYKTNTGVRFTYTHFQCYNLFQTHKVTDIYKGWLFKKFRTCSAVTGILWISANFAKVSKSCLRSLWHPHRINGVVWLYLRISGYHWKQIRKNRFLLTDGFPWKICKNDRINRHGYLGWITNHSIQKSITDMHTSFQKWS